MEDLATLGIAVDARQVDSAGVSLDKLTEKGGKTEKAIENLVADTEALGKAATGTTSDIDRLVASNGSLGNAVDKATAAHRKSSNELAKAVTEASKLIAETQKLTAIELAQARAAGEAAAAARAAAAAAKAQGDEAADLAARTERLRGSIDPLYAAQSRLDAEMREAATLYKAGAIGAAEYATATGVLQGKLDRVAQLQQKAAGGAKLHAHEMLNLTRQSSDVAVSLAMGMNPLMVLIQQGPQIKETFDMAATRGMTATGVMRQFAAATWAAVAPFAPLIAGAVALAAIIGGGFAIATAQANDSVGDLTKELGLSEKQLDRLKDSGESAKITFGDTLGATMEVAGSRLYNAFKGPIDAVVGFFSDLWDKIVSGLDWTIGAIVGGFVGASAAIRATWRMIPAAIADAAVSAANAAIGAIEWLVNKAREKVNVLIRGANGLADKVGLGGILSEFEPVAMERLQNSFAGSMEALAETGAERFIAGMARGRQYWQDFKSDVTDEAKDRAVARILEAAGEDPANASRQRKSEAQKELERVIKQSEDFVTQLEKEAATLGMNAIEKKEWEIATQAAIAAHYGLDELADSIERVGAALVNSMRAEQINEVLESLEVEAQTLAKQRELINATNRERTVELAMLAARQDLLDKGIPLEEAGARAILALTRANAEAQADLDEGVGSTAAGLERVSVLARSAADDIKDAAGGMADAFGSVGKAIGDVVSIYADLIANQAEYDQQIEDARLNNDTAEMTRLAKRRRDAEVGAYGDMISAAKGFFKEKSLGYKVLEGAEKAYRLFEFAMSVKSIAVKAAETAAKLPHYLAQATAAAMAGAAEMFATLGPLGFAAVAAMGVTLAAFGFRGGGGSGQSVPTAQERQEAQGRGSVFGDASAVSESLANALSMAEQYQNKDLDYSNSMVKALRNIEGNIGALASAVVRSMSVGGNLDTSGLNLGTSGRPATLGNLGFGNTTTRNLNDQGLDLGSQTVGSILGGGVTGNTFQEIIETTVKKIFGITYSNKTKTRTVTNPLGDDLSGEIEDVIKGLRAGVLEAATALGLEGSQAVIDAFVVNIGKVSFADMTGAEIQETLNAIFGKVGDDMAKAVGSGLVERFQKVGEGALETLVRLATGVKVFDEQMTLIGKTLDLSGVAAIEAKQNLIDLMGGLDSFLELTNSYAENFLTEAERLVPIQRAVAAEMAKLGYSSVDTKDEFKALVNSLDLSTDAGQALFAALMQVAPAFAKVADAAEAAAEAAKKAAEEAAAAIAKALQDAVDVANKAVDDARNVLKQAYERELAGLTANLNVAQARLSAARSGLIASYNAEVAAIRDRNAAADDAVTRARETLAAAYERETSALNQTITKFREFSRTLREFRESLTGGKAGGLSPEELYRATKDEFEETARKAAGGDADAIARLASVGQAFVSASRDYFGSSQGFQDDIAAVTAAVDRAIASSDQQADVAEQQLTQLNLMVSGLLTVNGSVIGVGQAVGMLQAALMAQVQTREQGERDLSALNHMLDMLDGVEDGIFTLGDQTYRLVDGVFALDNGLLDIVSAIEELELAEELVKKAEEEIEALKALVDPLLNINSSVLSVRDAIGALAGAIAAQAAALAAQTAAQEAARAAAEAAARDAANRAAAEAKRQLELGRPQINNGGQDGFNGNFKDTVTQPPIVQPPVIDDDPVTPVVQNPGGGGGGDYPDLYGWRWDRFGGGGGGGLIDVQTQAFAQGGIINRPMTVGEAGIAGEAGKEAIMPLTSIGGKLGVSVKTSDDETKSLLKQILDMLTKANNQRGAAATETLKATAELIENFDALKREVARG